MIKRKFLKIERKQNFPQVGFMILLLEIFLKLMQVSIGKVYLRM